MVRRLALLGIFLILALAGSRAAMAHDDDDDGYDNHDNQIQVLAHDLDDAATHVWQQASEERHHMTPQEQYSIDRLRVFAERAHHFHEMVEQEWTHPEHLRRDYARLYRAFGQARFANHLLLHGTRHEQGDFRRAEAAMARLDEALRTGVYHEDRYDGQWTPYWNHR